MAGPSKRLNTSDLDSSLSNPPKWRRIAAAKARKDQQNVAPVGFALDYLRPQRRSKLDLDVRFFPSGLNPGSLVELNGASGSGKTFLVTYFLARVVTLSPTNTAVLINTSRHFQYHNLISIIAHFDPEVKVARDLNAVTLSEIASTVPKLKSYMERIFVVNCRSAEELCLILGWGGMNGPTPSLNQMCLTNQNLSLIVIDSIDEFTFAKSLKNTPKNSLPSVMKLVQTSVQDTQTPVICCVNMSYENRLFVTNKDEKQRVSYTEENGSDAILDENDGSYHNILIEYDLFTHSMHLDSIPTPQTAKQPQPGSSSNASPKTATSIAYLRSRKNPKTASAGPSHRTRFSILSGMLYVDDTDIHKKPRTSSSVTIK